MIAGIEAAQVFALVSLVIKNFAMLVIAFIAAFFAMSGVVRLNSQHIKSLKLGQFLDKKEVEVMFGFAFIAYIIMVLIWGF